MSLLSPASLNLEKDYGELVISPPIKEKLTEPSIGLSLSNTFYYYEDNDPESDGDWVLSLEDDVSIFLQKRYNHFRLERELPSSNC